VNFTQREGNGAATMPQGPKQKLPGHGGGEINCLILVKRLLESTAQLYTKVEQAVLGGHRFLIAALSSVGVTSPVHSELGST
jgi:hypothetical protein